MIPLGPVVARSRTKATRATVWAYLTDSNLRAQWWDGLQVEGGLGGAVRLTGESRALDGVIDVWVAGHALGFTWEAEGEDRGTAVLITLRSQGYHTGVTVTETGFDSLARGAANADLAGREWTKFVDALAEASLAGEEDPEATVAGAGAGESALGGGATAEAVTGEAATASVAIVHDEAVADQTAMLGSGESDETSSDTSAVERAPIEIEGEFADNPEREPIEVDAEPGVGDHLELVTGPIALPFARSVAANQPGNEVSKGDQTNAGLPSDGGLQGDGESASEEALSEGLVPLVLPEPHEIPLVLPEPPGDIMASRAQSLASDDTVVIERITDAEALDNAAADAVDSTASTDAGDSEDEGPDEPDFDSLLRGPGL